MLPNNDTAIVPNLVLSNQLFLAGTEENYGCLF